MYSKENNKWDYEYNKINNGTGNMFIVITVAWVLNTFSLPLQPKLDIPEL